MRFSVAYAPADTPSLALIVLQADETLERDVARVVPPHLHPMVSRIASGAEVSRETLTAMGGGLTDAAALFPADHVFDVVGYGCTSAAAEIGTERVGQLIRAGVKAHEVTEPVSATVAACRALGLRRIALISPYVAAVSERLRGVLASEGIETPAFGSFEEPEEARVVRIDRPSILGAAQAVAAGVDGLFLSCTNLRAFGLVDELEAALDMPVLTSNQTLLWHMAQLAGIPNDIPVPGRLGRL